MKLSSYLKDKTIANGLPAQAYTDEEFWIKECKTVFADNWVFVGFAHELNSLGDVLPISVAGKPILLVKNRNGNIVALYGEIF